MTDNSVKDNKVKFARGKDISISDMNDDTKIYFNQKSTGINEIWLGDQKYSSSLEPLIVHATKQEKASDDTSANDKCTLDHTAKEIYEAMASGRVVQAYVNMPDTYTGTDGKTQDLTLIRRGIDNSYPLEKAIYFLQDKQYSIYFYRIIYDNHSDAYTDGSDKVTLRGLKVEVLRMMSVAADETEAELYTDWYAHNGLPALDLVKAKIRAELAAETTRAKAAEQANAAAISAEATRAKAAEQVNADAIATEVTRAKAAEKANTDAISAETARAESVEKTNTDAITAETTRAQAAEKSNADAIAGEITRAKAAEKANTDAISKASPLIITGKYDSSVSPHTVTLTGMTVKDIYDAAESGKQVILNSVKYGSLQAQWYLDIANSFAGYYIVFNGKSSFLQSDGHAAEDSTTLYENYDSTVDSTASGDGSHAEGTYTTASGGAGAHAEGQGTTASGMYSHAEGTYTTASKDGAHAEGSYTIAASWDQHVSGRWNIADTSNTYAEIIGNGKGGNAQSRSNARTLDWSGNEWVAGKLTMGADPTADMDAVPLKRFNALAARVAALEQKLNAETS